MMGNHSFFYITWVFLGIIYFVMTLIAYGRAKPQHKMAVLSGWWCFLLIISQKEIKSCS
jgi:hypothetical protein